MLPCLFLFDKAARSARAQTACQRYKTFHWTARHLSAGEPSRKNKQSLIIRYSTMEFQFLATFGFLNLPISRSRTKTCFPWIHCNLSQISLANFRFPRGFEKSEFRCIIREVARKGQSCPNRLKGNWLLTRKSVPKHAHSTSWKDRVEFLVGLQFVLTAESLCVTYCKRQTP